MSTNKSWTKKAALKEISDLIAKIEPLKAEKRLSEKHVRWTMRTTSFLEEVFGQDSNYFANFNALTWRQEGSFMVGGPSRPEESMDPQLGAERVNQEAYIKHLGIAKGVLLAAKDKLGKKTISSVYKGKDTPKETSLLIKVQSLAEYKLRKVIRKKPRREKEVQEAFESLLVGADVPYSREKDSIEYSTKTYTPDFTITKTDLAIDIKLCASVGREKEMIAEINDDILAYKTKYGNIFFIVYDVGFIRDIERFVKNFQDEEGVIVKVIKH